MQKKFKKLIASTLVCGMLPGISVSALDPKIRQEFESTFKSRAILDEGFSETNANDIIGKITDVFKKYPTLVNKLISHRSLVIKPFELIQGEYYPDELKDSVEVLTGAFQYKVEGAFTSLFVDIYDTKAILESLISTTDLKDQYDELITAELSSLLIHVVVYDRHTSKPEIQGRILPDRYFNEIKKEILALAHTRYGYKGSGELMKGKRILSFGKDFGDTVINSKEWLVGLISDVLTGQETFDAPLRAAANDWLKEQ